VPMEEEEVSILRFSMFVEKKFLLWTKNISKGNRYGDVKGKTFNFLNNFLHKTVIPDPPIILIPPPPPFAGYYGTMRRVSQNIIP
jgi:hypothetical protein